MCYKIEAESNKYSISYINIEELITPSVIKEKVSISDQLSKSFTTLMKLASQGFLRTPVRMFHFINQN